MSAVTNCNQTVTEEDTTLVPTDETKVEDDFDDGQPLELLIGRVLLLLVGCIGVIANGIVVLVFLKRRKLLQKATNVYLLNQSLIGEFYFKFQVY